MFDVLQRSSRQSVYREIAEAGHAVCQEQPEQVARAIVEIVENKANAHA